MTNTNEVKLPRRSQLRKWPGKCFLIVMLLATRVISTAQTFTTLVNFDGSNGIATNSLVASSLVQATNGSLYGTTNSGGMYNFGTIFKITPAGTLTTIYNFNLADGAGPVAGLVQATNGYLYGTTQYGGTYGLGTIFKITPAGDLTTLHSFDSTDGVYPNGLVQAANGSLYGTAQAGGANGATSGYGTIFKITPAGLFTPLHNFNGTDGQGPTAGLVQATNGALYGTTIAGGTYGNGTVFKITPAGVLTTLYSFCAQSNCADGLEPFAGLVQATNGYLYGTTIIGGINGADGHGTIFRITPAGALTTMHRFRSSDGAGPTAGLVQATDGSLYGTTPAGGSNNYGTIFKITTNGTFTSLHSFDATGTYPQAGLVQDTNGSFYGATSGGGTGDGTLFELSMGLGPFVKTLPTWGEVGSAVKILGTNLTGATSVTFNGTPAVFTVVSAAEITTTVPAGATSGNVQVVTPNATLTSNVAFQVP